MIQQYIGRDEILLCSEHTHTHTLIHPSMVVWENNTVRLCRFGLHTHHIHVYCYYAASQFFCLPCMRPLLFVNYFLWPAGQNQQDPRTKRNFSLDTTSIQSVLGLKTALRCDCHSFTLQQQLVTFMLNSQQHNKSIAPRSSFRRQQQQQRRRPNSVLGLKPAVYYI